MICVGSAPPARLPESNHSLALCSRRMRKLKCALSLLIVGRGAIRSRRDMASAHRADLHALRSDLAHRCRRENGSGASPLCKRRSCPLKSDDVLTLGATRDKILASAPKAASEVLATLTPRFIRDENKVIQCAVLESENPLTASVCSRRVRVVFPRDSGPGCSRSNS